MSNVVATLCLAANVFSCQPGIVTVVDGDTIRIGSERIRVLGIDAPEMKGACRAESTLAVHAKDHVAALLNGAQVVIDRDGRDKYSRTLARVAVDGQDLGEILMREGLARKWEAKWRPGLDEIWCKG